MEREPSLYTIGHSNHSLEKFLGLLARHAIEVLVDTRSYPQSQYSPHFNRAPLSVAVTENGMRYAFWGNALGGRPEGDRFYDDAKHVLYSEVAQADFFLAAIDKLQNGIRKHRVALLCSEEDPSVCHRKLLVGRVLIEQGVNLLHIRGDGSVQTDAELERDRQAGLFEEMEEWKSLRSAPTARGKAPSFLSPITHPPAPSLASERGGV